MAPFGHWYILVGLKKELSDSFTTLLKVLSTWRSGSTFVGEVVHSHRDVFYHYEPFLHYDIRQVRANDVERAAEAVKTVKDLFSCRYDNLG